jgi:hypothetical protein
MQAFIVRPLITGLLALIIAGLWGAPLGIRGGGAFLQSGCRGAPAAAGAAIAHREPRC